MINRTSEPPLTERQAQILAFLREHAGRHNYVPAPREIADHLGIASRNHVIVQLRVLDRLGVVVRSKNGLRKLRVLEPSFKFRALRLTLYVAGAATSENGGMSCYGWSVWDFHEREQGTGAGVGWWGKPALLEAGAWVGLRSALGWVVRDVRRDRTVRGLRIATDSPVLVDQLKGRCGVERDGLKQLRQDCWDLLNVLHRRWETICVSEKENARAVDMAREARRLAIEQSPEPARVPRPRMGARQLDQTT